MSQHCSLPPPILDPSSGKTFIAIRAPSFIFKNGNQDRRENSESSNFVYVEDMAHMQSPATAKPARMSLPAHVSKDDKLSVDSWMVRNRTSIY